ncbi:hypothetical protein [Brevundimonas sp.]|uniref:hypothetical protein n=1 Tax=Brevundimonas sp. TaxID=1871086 RepID=UPI001D715BAE|nr:hypothetical protein [Brevundimonas sp.]MBA3999177.1 hypothetical protein [Brevundimonas sp.]
MGGLTLSNYWIGPATFLATLWWVYVVAAAVSVLYAVRVKSLSRGVVLVAGALLPIVAYLLGAMTIGSWGHLSAPNAIYDLLVVCVALAWPAIVVGLILKGTAMVAFKSVLGAAAHARR